MSKHRPIAPKKKRARQDNSRFAQQTTKNGSPLRAGCRLAERQALAVKSALAALLATLARFVLALLLLTGLVLPALLLLAGFVLAALLRVVLAVLRIVLFVSHRDVLREGLH
jgi:hypothetical protein